MTIKLGRFAIVFGSDDGDKHFALQVTFHWGYNEPKVNKD